MLVFVAEWSMDKMKGYIMEREEKNRVLEELGGISEEVYDELLKELAVQSKGEAIQLKEFLIAGDAENAERAAHSIRGAAGNLRIKEVQELACTISDALKEKAEPSLLLEKCEELITRIQELNSAK